MAVQQAALQQAALQQAALHQAALQQLPRKEFLLTATAQRRALTGLLDLLYAYCYDVRARRALARQPPLPAQRSDAR